MIVGSGRVGSAIAMRMLEEGHEVSVLDEDPEAIAQLEKGIEGTWVDAGGSFTVGTALEMDALEEAGIERADAFVALPGGLGTLEEVVEIATWAQLERHHKPVLMVNVGGFWDSLIALFRRMYADGFLSKPFLGHTDDLPIQFCSDVSEVIPTIETLLARQPEGARAMPRARLM